MSLSWKESLLENPSIIALRKMQQDAKHSVIALAQEGVWYAIDRSPRSSRPDMCRPRSDPAFLHAGHADGTRNLRRRPSGVPVRQPENQSPRPWRRIRTQGARARAWRAG